MQQKMAILRSPLARESRQQIQVTCVHCIYEKIAYKMKLRSLNPEKAVPKHQSYGKKKPKSIRTSKSKLETPFEMRLRSQAKKEEILVKTLPKSKSKFIEIYLNIVNYCVYLCSCFDSFLLNPFFSFFQRQKFSQ